MAIETSHFYQGFLIEAESLLAEVEQLLLSIDVEYPSMDALNTTTDTLPKADAIMTGYMRMTEITYILEGLVSKLHTNELKFNENLDSLITATDMFKVTIGTISLSTPTNHRQCK